MTLSLHRILWMFWKKNDCYLETFYSFFPGPFNKPLCGSCQWTPQKLKRKTDAFQVFEAKKVNCSLSYLWISPFVFHWSFLLCKVQQQWIHLTQKYYSNCQIGREHFLKPASRYEWKELNHVTMLVVHLAAAVCVLHWRVGSDPGCVTSLAQNCHSFPVLLQATLHLHANASH